jgi:hypothetical protein
MLPPYVVAAGAGSARGSSNQQRGEEQHHQHDNNSSSSSSGQNTTISNSVESPQQIRFPSTNNNGWQQHHAMAGTFLHSAMVGNVEPYYNQQSYAVIPQSVFGNFHPEQQAQRQQQYALLSDQLQPNTTANGLALQRMAMPISNHSQAVPYMVPHSFFNFPQQTNATQFPYFASPMHTQLQMTGGMAFNHPSAIADSNFHPSAFLSTQPASIIPPNVASFETSTKGGTAVKRSSNSGSSSSSADGRYELSGRSRSRESSSLADSYGSSSTDSNQVPLAPNKRNRRNAQDVHKSLEEDNSEDMNAPSFRGERRLTIRFIHYGHRPMGYPIQYFGNSRMPIPDGLSGTHTMYSQDWRFEIKYTKDSDSKLTVLQWIIENLSSKAILSIIESPEQAVARQTRGITVCNRAMKLALNQRADELEQQMKQGLRNPVQQSNLSDLIRKLRPKQCSDGLLFFGLRHDVIRQIMITELGYGRSQDSASKASNIDETEEKKKLSSSVDVGQSSVVSSPNELSRDGTQ